MALVQLPTVEEAITALVRLHNYQLSETSHLRYWGDIALNIRPFLPLSGQTGCSDNGGGVDGCSEIVCSVTKKSDIIGTSYNEPVLAKPG